MSNFEISLIAVEVRKWDSEIQKITMVGYYLLDEEEKNPTFEVSILQPPEMVEEFLGRLRYEAELKLREKHQDEKIEVGFDNETFLRQKIYNYFKRITSELNNPRRKKGQPKMILTTHMDVYNENQDISFLPSRFQFYVILNWARKYYEKEDYKKAIEPLRKLVKFAPDYGIGYKWLARSLKKVRKYDEAMRNYEKYAEVDDSTEARLDLAKSYRKGKIFDKSEEIYHKILAEEPANKEARIGLAQIYYANKEDKYLEFLDALHQEDPEWLKLWLVEEFNFRIYISEKTLLSPVQAAKFLGYQQIFELTQRAFKNEIPSHFNPSKARLSFYKEELENWGMVMNRYNCLPQTIELFPDKIDQVEDNLAAMEIEAAPIIEGGIAQPGRQLTKVEEILLQIRARKAQRNAGQLTDNEPDAANNNPALRSNNNKKRRKNANDNNSTKRIETKPPKAKPAAAAKSGDGKPKSGKKSSAKPKSQKAKPASRKKNTSAKKTDNGK